MKNSSKVLQILKQEYPDARPELNFTNPFELMIAVVLSAQCTDVRVNIVTKELFAIIKNPSDILDLGVDKLEDAIRTCGLYKTKAKNIYETCRIICERFDGNVPDTLESLMELPGVGRKSANVIVSNAFDTPAIAVDTHVFRVSNRIGLAKAGDVFKTEKQLMEIIPKKDWTFMHHVLIFHGRRVCKARKPVCRECCIMDYCDFYLNMLGADESNV